MVIELGVQLINIELNGEDEEVAKISRAFDNFKGAKFLFWRNQQYELWKWTSHNSIGHSLAFKNALAINISFHPEQPKADVYLRLRYDRLIANKANLSL